MNALMLALAFRLGGTRFSALRVMMGAVCGAAIAQAAKGISHMQTLLLWMPTALVMIRTAGGKASPSRMLSGALLLMCSSGLVGGIILALWGATGSLFAAYVLGGLAAGCIGLCAGRAARHGKRAVHVRMRCTCPAGSAAFDAMIDSGNTLMDYLTHLPVIVLAEQTGRQALGLEASLLRPIFAQTAGGRQKMYVFAPEAVALDIDGEHLAVRAVIALSPGMSASVPALVPASLLDGLRNSNRGG